MALPEKIQRFKFCSSHQDKVESFWKEQVSFCDEQIFAFDEDGKAYLSKGSIPPNKMNAGHSFAVFMAISGSGQHLIAKIEGRYGSEQLLSLIKRHIAMQQTENISQQPYVMDSFPVHSCAGVKSWFTSRKGDILLLPPSSPDLMPIGKLAEWIVKRINCQRNDVNDCPILWEKVYESFNDPSFKNEIKSLLHDFPSTLKHILESGGNL